MIADRRPFERQFGVLCLNAHAFVGMDECGTAEREDGVSNQHAAEEVVSDLRALLGILELDRRLSVDEQAEALVLVEEAGLDDGDRLLDAHPTFTVPRNGCALEEHLRLIAARFNDLQRL